MCTFINKISKSKSLLLLLQRILLLLLLLLLQLILKLLLLLLLLLLPILLLILILILRLMLLLQALHTQGDQKFWVFLFHLEKLGSKPPNVKFTHQSFFLVIIGCLMSWVVTWLNLIQEINTIGHSIAFEKVSCLAFF